MRKHIGPAARGIATFFSIDIGISTRNVPRATDGLCGLTFVAATTIAISRELAQRAKPVVEDIEKKLSSTDGPVYADETDLVTVKKPREVDATGHRHSWRTCKHIGLSVRCQNNRDTQKGCANGGRATQ